MSYKASVSNIYELLNEDGDVRQTPQVNVGGSDDKSVAKKPTTAAPAKTQAKPKTDAPKADRPAQPKADRRPRDAAPRAGAEGEEVVARQQRRPHKEGSERAGRGGFVPRGGKREFDRRSGTGRGPRENKKGGAGGHNWGTVQDDQVAQSETTKQEEKTETPEGQAPAAEAQPQETVEPKVEEEEDKTKTFEEYLKAKKAVAVELPKARQAGEGVTGEEWKGFVALKKKDEEEEGLAGKKEEKKPAAKKDVVPVNEVFKIQEEKKRRDDRDDRGSRGGRGGRGGFKGRGGSSAKRGPSGPAPNVNDESSFPALATKA